MILNLHSKNLLISISLLNLKSRISNWFLSISIFSPNTKYPKRVKVTSYQFCFISDWSPFGKTRKKNRSSQKKHSQLIWSALLPETGCGRPSKGFLIRKHPKRDNLMAFFLWILFYSLRMFMSVYRRFTHARISLVHCRCAVRTFYAYIFFSCFRFMEIVRSTYKAEPNKINQEALQYGGRPFCTMRVV